MTMPSWRPSRQFQLGVILPTSLIFLMVLTMLALSMVSNTTMEERMAGNSQKLNELLQSADSGLEKMFNNDDVYVYGKAVGPITISWDADPDDDVPASTLVYEKDVGEEFTIGRSADPRLIWSQDFSRYYFNTSATASNSSGLSKTTSAGALAIGKASNR